MVNISIVVQTGTQPLDMEAILTSPSGKSEACEVRDTAGHVYDIRFVPEEEGLHAVSIKYKGIHIAGSSVCYTLELFCKYNASCVFNVYNIAHIVNLYCIIF